MRSFAILTWLALGGSALSAPSLGDDLEIRNVNECNAVTVIISILSQYRASATSFCSSFISIPIKTVTSTNVCIYIVKDMYKVLILVDYNIDAKTLDSDSNHDNYSHDVRHSSHRTIIVTVLIRDKKRILT